MKTESLVSFSWPAFSHLLTPRDDPPPQAMKALNFVSCWNPSLRKVITRPEIVLKLLKLPPRKESRSPRKEGDGPTKKKLIYLKSNHTADSENTQRRILHVVELSKVTQEIPNKTDFLVSLWAK